MAYENLCMYCFEDMQGQTSCPHCGRDSRTAVPQIQMLPGSLVYHDRFLIGRALGQDASGIVYAAFDTKKENRLRIREYLPRDCAERLNDGAVVPIAGMEDQFEAGLKKLRASVEGVEDPRLRHFFFEENGTGYIAQRKSASAAAAEEGEPVDGDEGGSHRRILLFAGVAVGVLVVAAILLITVFNGLLPASRDITESPTLDPSQVWIPATTPTATPYVAPTFAALVDPELSWMEYTYEGDVEAEYQQAQRASATSTPTPAPLPTATIDNSAGTSKYKLVNGSSSSSDIRALQQKLADLGWLQSSQVTGEYDGDTRRAVREFQSYVNDHYAPVQRLSVDGAAGPMTLQWLYEVDVLKPTPSPTPRVTPEPDSDTVKESSPAAQVRSVQEKLIALGLLPEGSADGSYGATTAAAVRRFQQRVNQLSGYDVLEVTGSVDPQSMAFLNYYAEEWSRLREATAQPTATPAPTAVPTATPTTRPMESFDGVINASSPAQTIREVQQLLIDIAMLPAGSADGIYGSGTISAVADFQQWVNLQRDEQTLPVNGEVDQLTLGYLQYCVDHGMRPYGTPLPQTPSPEPTATEVPATQQPSEPPQEQPEEVGEISIDAGSDPESIRYVQQMLSAVGAMDESGVDGIYGGGTRSAVERFQRWVNSVQGEGTLPVTGLVDNATRLALEYAFDHELRLAEATEAPTEAPTPEPTEALTPEPTEVPTPEPTEVPTPEPTEVPTPEPTEVPTPEPAEEGEEGGEITVGADSDPESIRYVQQMLNAVRAMEAEGINGSYDEGTASAVRRFQLWVNTVQGEGTLPITGEVDDRTRQALEYAFDHELTIDRLSAEPEPTVGTVSAPDIAIGGIAAGDDIVPVEGDSLQINWIAQGDVQGYLVRVTDSSGSDISAPQRTTQTSATIPAGNMQPGEVYTLTVGAVPVGGTEADVQTSSARFMRPIQESPTPEPAPTVGTVSAPDIAIGGTVAGGDIIAVEGDSLQISWIAQGDVQGYLVRVTDANGGDISAPQRTTQTSATIPAGNMQPGEVYTLTVGAVPVGGTEADMQVSSARFMRPIQETPTPEPAPTVGTVSVPAITVAGVSADNGIIPVEGDSFQLSWAAQGDVDSYYVRMTDANGNDISAPQRTTQTGASLPTGGMEPGMVYTLTVGAVPVGGTEADMQVGTARFMRPVQETPTPEPTPQPVVANIGSPVINVGGSAYQRDGIPYMTDSAIILSWNADGDVQSYTVFVENQAGEQQQLGTTTDTSRTVATSSLPAGLYTIYVGALPRGGGSDDIRWSSATFGIPSPEAPAQATPEGDSAGGSRSVSGSISGSSDPDTIQQLQMRLYALGLLSTDGLEPGVLDTSTLQAVALFQQRMNEQYGAGLTVIDPSDLTSEIDAATVRALFAQ